MAKRTIGVSIMRHHIVRMPHVVQFQSADRKTPLASTALETVRGFSIGAILSAAIWITLLAFVLS